MIKNSNKRVMVTFTPKMLQQVDDIRSRSVLPFPDTLSTSQIIACALDFYVRLGSNFGQLKELYKDG